MSSRILVIGACSSIAQAVAARFAHRGARFVLAARNENRLHAVAKDLQARGAAELHCEILNVIDFQTHAEFVRKAISIFDGFDFVVLAHGVLPDQAACAENWKIARESFEVNALSVISLLEQFAPYAEQQKIGGFAVIGSVAGDRGRQSNYFYGAAKGAVEIYLSGLRARLHPAKVSVLTIKPGFIDTPMTSAFNKGLLWSQPEIIAKSIEAAILGKKDVIYVPGFWRMIMWIIRAIPETIFKRLKL